MTNDVFCFDCLAESNRRVSAVTDAAATAICEDSAREYAAAEIELSETIGRLPRVTTALGVH